MNKRLKLAVDEVRRAQLVAAAVVEDLRTRGACPTFHRALNLFHQGWRRFSGSVLDYDKSLGTIVDYQDILCWRGFTINGTDNAENHRLFLGIPWRVEEEVLRHLLNLTLEEKVPGPFEQGLSRYVNEALNQDRDFYVHDPGYQVGDINPRKRLMVLRYPVNDPTPTDGQIRSKVELVLNQLPERWIVQVKRAEY